MSNGSIAAGKILIKRVFTILAPCIAITSIPHNNIIGVYLMYKGEVLPNNGVALHDFVYGSNVSIYCVTDLRPCCTDPYAWQGEWYHIRRNDRYFGYIRTWRTIPSERISRYDNGTIALHIGPSWDNTGLYLCSLPNAANIAQYIYVGIYDQCKRPGYILVL